MSAFLAFYTAIYLIGIGVFLFKLKKTLKEYFIIKYNISTIDNGTYKELSKDELWGFKRLTNIGFYLLFICLFILIHFYCIERYSKGFVMGIFYFTVTLIILYMLYPIFTIKSRLLKYQNLSRKQ